MPSKPTAQAAVPQKASNPKPQQPQAATKGKADAKVAKDDKQTKQDNTPKNNKTEDQQKKSKVRPNPSSDASTPSTDEATITQPTKQQKQNNQQQKKNNDNNNNNNKKSQKSKADPNQLVQLGVDTKATDGNNKNNNNKDQKKKGEQKDNNKNNNNKTTPVTGDEKVKKYAKPELPALPLSLPIESVAIVNAPQSFLTLKLPPSVTQPPTNDQKQINDPSLEYYSNPFHAPIIKEAGQYFSSLPQSTYLLDWTAKIDQQTQSNYDQTNNNDNNQSNDINTPICPVVNKKLYNFDEHFASCQTCQKSTSVTKNLDFTTQQPQKSSSSSTTNTTEKTPYPFRVIMDTKDMWRTHGKFAVRPCSDHNTHLSLNKTWSNWAQPKDKEKDNKDDKKDDGKDKKDDKKDKKEDNKDGERVQGENYGKKNLSQGSAGLYRHMKHCQCGEAHIGLFGEGTRCIIPNIDQSPSHHPLLNHALKLVSAAITKSGIQPYSDIDGSGFLRYVVMSVPNTTENNLYQQWSVETQNGFKNDWKSDKKRPAKKITEKIHYPQVQLSLVWAEGINDEIKKSQKLIDIEPVLNLPFPYALNELKRPIFKAAYQPKKNNNKKGGNDKKEDNTNNTNSADVKVENAIKTNIPYAQQRHQSRQALYSFISTLVTQFKTVQQSFIQYANHHGYDVIIESLWQKEMAYCYQDLQNEAVAEKIPAEYNETIKNKKFNFDNTYTPVDIPTIVSTTGGEATTLPYQAPICTQCAQTHTTIETNKTIKPSLQQIISADFGLNPNLLKMPVVDSLNTQPTGVWGSIFVHYNNHWSHSNSVYALHKHSWHHVYGKHSIDEHVMDNGIPLSAIDYDESYKIAPQRNKIKKSNNDLRLAKNGVIIEKQNAVVKFDDSSDEEDTKTSKDDKDGKNTKTNDVKSTIVPTTQVALPKFSFSPSVFRQGNLHAFSHLLHHLITLLPVNTKHIVELHSGCGTISLHTLHHTQLLTASDVNANNKTTFQHATSQLIGPEEKSAILYDKKVLPYIPLSSDLLVKEEISFADVVILDPPRKGLDQTTLQYLSLPYVNPSTLYPGKNGGLAVGGIQPKPTVFPFDLSEKLYINRSAIKAAATAAVNKIKSDDAKKAMKDGSSSSDSSSSSSSDSDSDSDDDNNDKNKKPTANKDDGASVNKNTRDKKKWSLQYNQIVRKHTEKGTTLYSNTKEHHLEQLNKSVVNNSGPKKEYSKNSKTSDQKTAEMNEIISLPEVNGQHWLQTARVLVYVSCGFQAFKHDCDILTKGPGQWKIAHTHAHLLFPGSNHIETLTIFVRGIGK